MNRGSTKVRLAPFNMRSAILGTCLRLKLYWNKHGKKPKLPPTSLPNCFMEGVLLLLLLRITRLESPCSKNLPPPRFVLFTCSGDFSTEIFWPSIRGSVILRSWGALPPPRLCILPALPGFAASAMSICEPTLTALLMQFWNPLAGETSPAAPLNLGWCELLLLPRS